MFVCPSILDTVSMGTPFDSVVVVANVWRARWKMIAYARKSERMKIKRKLFEMSGISLFYQVEKMQTATEH